MAHQNPQKFDRREFLHFMGLGSISRLFHGFNQLPVQITHESATNPTELASIEVIIHIDIRLTQIQVSKQGKLLHSRGMGTAGIEMNNALMDYLKTRHRLLIGRLTAEQTIHEIGSALPLETSVTRIVRGRDTDSGIPKELEISDVEVREAIAKVIDDIVTHIALNLKHVVAVGDGCTLESITDIGLGGDFGKIKRLDERLQQATGKNIILR